MSRMKSSMTISIITMFFVAVLALSFMQTTAMGEDGGTEVFPASFYGTITIGGSPAPAGTQIKGVVDGEDMTHDGLDYINYFTEQEGYYGSLNMLYTKFKVKCEFGEIVSFYVISPSYEGYADQTSICKPGNDTNVNLTVNGQGQDNCVDNDGDGYDGYNEISCPSGPDCDDTNDQIYPGAEEICNGLDDDCSGEPGADEVDADSDGYMVCENDCDDTDGTVHPGAEEICDGIDNDCSGEPGADEVDADSDGYMVCENDCDDSNGQINPGATEICDNQLDDDCDMLTDCSDVMDCYDFPGCAAEEYCIEITGMRILDQDFNEVTSVTAGTMYNIEVTNANVCEDPVAPMQIVQVSELVGEAEMPVHIGTMKSVIQPGESSVVTAGFIMPFDTPSETGFRAQAFNWNSWVTQPGFEALSEPSSLDFQVA